MDGRQKQLNQSIKKVLIEMYLKTFLFCTFVSAMEFDC